MSNPDVFLSGTLLDTSNNPTAGKVVFTLVNYGDNIPLISGTGEFAQLNVTAQAATNGKWSVSLYSNTVAISPVNTYYQAARYPAGANSPSLVASYSFIPGTYDLSTQTPVQSPGTPFPPAVNTNIATQAAPLGDFFNGFNATNATFSYSAQQSWSLSLKDQNASAGAAHGIRLGAGITATLKVLTIASTGAFPFSNSDVGKNIKVVGAGAAGADLYTTIASFQSVTQVTLTAAAGTTVSSATAVWWTAGQDTIDRQALEAATAACSTLQGNVYCPPGFYLYDQTPNWNPNTHFKKFFGDGLREAIWAASSATAGSFCAPSGTPPRWESYSGFSVYGPGYIPCAAVTNISLTTNVITATCANAFTVGQTVYLRLLTSTLALNNQKLTVATASSTQFTANYTHADITSTPDNGVAYVLESAFVMSAGLWFGSIEEVEIYGFQGAGIEVITPILNTWHRIWVHNCGWAGYSIGVIPPTAVGATVHGMYNCYALGCYGPGMFGYYMQSTTIANCAFESCGGAIILDSCAPMAFTSPHCEQIIYRNASLPGKFIELRGCRNIVFVAPFCILDSGGNVAQTVWAFNSNGTNNTIECVQNSVINGNYVMDGNAPTTIVNFEDSGCRYNKVDEPKILSTTLTFADSGLNNSIMYNGVEQTQGYKQLNITAPSGTGQLKVVGSAGVGLITLYQTVDTTPRISLTNQAKILFSDGTTQDMDISRTSNGIHTHLNNGGIAQQWDCSLVGDSFSRAGFEIDASNNPCVFFGPTVNGAGDTFINRQGPAIVGIGTGVTGISGTVRAAVFGMSTDTGISRISAAVVGVGNGTNGDFSGTLKAATVNATTGYSANGTAGVSVSGSSVTAITTSLGIVTALTVTSDERLKKNIKKLKSGLSVVEGISPISFNWNRKGLKISGFPAEHPTQYGFSAQNIAEVFPEASGTEGEYKTVNQWAILGAAVNAIKELSAENKRLQKRIAKLEKTKK